MKHNVGYGIYQYFDLSFDQALSYNTPPPHNFTNLHSLQGLACESGYITFIFIYFKPLFTESYCTLHESIILLLLSTKYVKCKIIIIFLW